MSDLIYRAGIIGLGFIGGADQISGDRIGQRVADLDGTHLHALASNPRVKLVAGSSSDAGRRQRFAEKTGAQTHADWREMLRKERLDIVSIATCAPLHAEMTVACAGEGVRAIYCEKPMATRLTDAEGMASACKNAGALLVINHNRRFNPNYRRLRQFVADGGLGQLTSASLQWGAGRLAGVGTHLFDALQMLTGDVVRSVSATLDSSGRPDCRGPDFKDPGGWGLLRFEGGLMATLDAADHGAMPARLVLNGTQARAVTGGEDVTLERWNGENEIWPSRRHERTSMDRAVAEIVSALDGSAEFPYPAEEAVNAPQIVVACHVSHARNAAWVELPLAGRDREIEVRAA
jgi:UDP-N-acetylglucosamine 3-dehydrogenase